MSKRFLGASPLPAVPEYDSVEASLAVSRCLLFCSGSLLRAQYFQLSMTALFGYSVTLVSGTKNSNASFSRRGRCDCHALSSIPRNVGQQLKR